MDISTRTEAAVVAVVYAIPVGLFVCTELEFRAIGQAVVSIATKTGMIMVILVFSFVATRIFTLEHVPHLLGAG